ncbi:MAG: hypothetical protein ACRYGP_13915 [Janthinobacterium lividum]
MLLLLGGGVALAIAAFFFRVLFVPKQMHAGFDRGVEATFLNMMRFGVIVLVLIVLYAIFFLK